MVVCSSGSWISISGQASGSNQYTCLMEIPYLKDISYIYIYYCAEIKGDYNAQVLITLQN